jgi:hypothetical protein
MARLLRRLHRLHRALGSVLCVLMASWFLSGAVMTFAGYPSYGERARLRDLPSLGELPETALSPALAAQVQRFMVHEPGAELSLIRPLEEPRILLRSQGEVVAVLSLRAADASPPLSEEQAREIAERVVGAPAHQVERLDQSDQWSVALPRAVFPLFRVSLADGEHSELYVSAASAEIVQRTTRKDRVLAWLGAIPHWVYPTLLRRERALWRNVVIALASFGLVLTSAGLIAGLDTARRVRRRRARQGPPINDAALRLHQRIGLGFGLLALCWLFSGVLSFNPFDWTASRGLWSRAEQSLRGSPSEAGQLPWARLLDALTLCQRALDVRELRVRYLTGTPIATCLGVDGARRLLVLTEDALKIERELPGPLLNAAAQAIAGRDVRFRAQRVDRADQYYYPTHTEPDLVLPCIRVDAEDRVRTRYYLDPISGELLRTLTARLRLERYLFHGLHSWDFAFLYEQRGLWRAAVLSAMGLGASLSLLGVALTLRRLLRRRNSLRRQRARELAARAVLDKSGESVG